MTAAGRADSTSTSREVDNGKSTERRSSIARAEGFGRRDVGPAGCGAVRGRRIERDPLDRSGKDGRTDAPTAGAATRVQLIEERKDITLNEMVERLAAERSVRISRSALSAWLGRHGWTFKKSPHTHWSRIAPTS